MNLVSVLRKITKSNYNDYNLLEYYSQDILKRLLSEVIAEAFKNRFVYSQIFNLYKKDVNPFIKYLKDCGFIVAYSLDKINSACYCDECLKLIQINLDLNWEDPLIKEREKLL